MPVFVLGVESRYFFFSSRRRHTRLVSDWSSDVCSSDLALDEVAFNLRGWLVGQVCLMALIGVTTAAGLWLLGIPMALTLSLLAGILELVQIGRASCRERGESWGLAGGVARRGRGGRLCA